MVHHMTTHTNCTHPATKAARAACRKGLAPTDVARIASSSALAAKANADYSTMNYEFETTVCDRCFGGTPGYLAHYAGVYGGVCFGCNKSGNSKTKGRKLTRAGAAARKAHDAWIADHLMIPARDLQPGMKFRPSPVDGWKTVVSIDAEPRRTGTMTVGSGDDAVTTEMWSITVETKNCHYGLGVDSPVQRAATPEERNALIAAIAGRKGTILTPKN